MTKKRSIPTGRAKAKKAKPERSSGTAPGGRPRPARAPAVPSLLSLTHSGFAALRRRLAVPARASTESQAGIQRQEPGALSEALTRLEADYDRVLRRAKVE